MKRWKVIDEYRYSYPGNITPVLYVKGTEMESENLGFFVLPTLKAAENYRDSGLREGETNLQIIEVEAIGKGKHIVACPTSIQNIDNYAKYLKEITTEVKNRGKAEYRHGDKMNVIYKYIYCGLPVWKCAEGSMVYPTLKVLT